MLACQTLEQLYDKDFARYLGGGLLALPPGVPADGLEDDVDLGDDDAARVLLAANAAPVALAANPAALLAERVIGGVSIKFDNWSHSSGKRRGYATCTNAEHCGERGCFRYRTLSGFQDVKQACAFLHAWAVHGRDRPSHDDHKFFEPSARQVAASLELVQ